MKFNMKFLMAFLSIPFLLIANNEDDLRATMELYYPNKQQYKKQQEIRNSYTKQEIKQKQELYNSEQLKAKLITTQSAASLAKIIDPYQLCSIKEINDLLSSIENLSLSSLYQANSLILKITSMMSQNLSIEDLSILVKAVSNIIEYTNQKNFTSDHSFKADQMLLNVAKLLESDTLTVQKIELILGLEDKLIEYVQKNNIQYSQSVPEKLKSILFNKAEIVPVLVGVIDKKNHLAGWVMTTLKDYYIYQGDDYKNFDYEKWSKWKQIIQSKPKAVIKNNYQIQKGSRFLFEVWLPENQEQENNLFGELDFAKSRGYNGVVVVWDGTSDYNKLATIQQKILDKGFKIWLAFSTTKKDALNKTSFVEPQYYKKGLIQLAKRSQAFLMGWRRTSLHLNQQIKQWQDYTMSALRQGNPNIGFIGQTYFGYNGTHKPTQFHLYVNYRQNYNAVLAINFGFLSVNPKWAINKLKQTLPISNIQYVCLIQGVTATYLKQDVTSVRKKRTKAQYRRINELLQKRFLRAGFDAVCGLSGDGVNRQGAQDDMCLSKNRINDNKKY